MLKETQTIWMEETDSTNNEIRRRLEQIKDMTFLACSRQTSGRGQGDHVWKSEPGANLTFSMLLRFEEGCLPVNELQRINDFITGVVLEILEEENVKAWVKLPNDIWVDDKKICGILIENILHGKYVSETIIGVGLNLNQENWSPELPNPVSLKQLTGKRYPPEQMLERIVSVCKKNWESSFKRSATL